MKKSLSDEDEIRKAEISGTDSILHSIRHACFHLLTNCHFLFSEVMESINLILRHPYLLVGIGGALGSVARAGMTDLITRWIGMGNLFPFGTVVVNITGAFLMGFLAGYGETDPGKLIFSPGVRTFMMIGVLGGYTTFSSFSLQTFLLMEQGNWIGAFLNVFLSVFLCIAGIWLGFSVIRVCQ